MNPVNPGAWPCLGEECQNLCNANHHSQFPESVGPLREGSKQKNILMEKLARQQITLKSVFEFENRVPNNHPWPQDFGSGPPSPPLYKTEADLVQWGWKATASHCNPWADFFPCTRQGQYSMNAPWMWGGGVPTTQSGRVPWKWGHAVFPFPLPNPKPDFRGSDDG